MFTLVRLMQVGFEDLKAATDRRYYKFRSQQLLHLDDPNMCAPFFSLLASGCSTSYRQHIRAEKINAVALPVAISMRACLRHICRTDSISEQ